MLRRMFAFAAIAYLAVSASLAARSQVPGSAPAAEAAAAPAPPARDSSAARPSMPPPGSPGANPPAMRAAMAPPDSFAAERDSLMNDVLEKIAGRENAPAESVFKNIRLLKGVPAGRLPRIMNFGFGRSLGVRCRHCHVEGHWDAEDKPQKQIARDMSEMLHTINTELLPKVKNLKSEHPTVNCTTCHRGAVKPALNL
ncbi:MAG: c-type cytochrome [Candidatus Eisenbacteria bacterium]|uniref:C-type cytochrome n=1 Tax=Eiseniibacteriota bacterium TaxID=2212470 RepID=A0A538SMG5_UNCEI|nr:MAG: c-type cytochrome [Candidatus Eisenbacteria bacterium]